MFRTLVLLCVASVLVTAQRTDVSPCIHNAGPLPSRTYIEGCRTPPCQLPRLQDLDFSMDFTAPRNINSMKTLVTLYINLGAIPIPVKYDLREKSETCNYVTNSRCPLRRGERVETSFSLYISEIIPLYAAATVELQVVDEQDSAVTCVRVPILVAPAVDNTH